MNHYEPAESDDRPDRCRMITTDELTEAIPEFEWDRGFTEHIVDTLMLLCHDKSVPYLDYVRNIVESGKKLHSP